MLSGDRAYCLCLFLCAEFYSQYIMRPITYHLVCPPKKKYQVLISTGKMSYFLSLDNPFFRLLTLKRDINIRFTFCAPWPKYYRNLHQDLGSDQRNPGFRNLPSLECLRRDEFWHDLRRNAHLELAWG